MEQFLKQHEADVNGTISGWDRISLRGTIRWLANASGLRTYMSNHGILLKNFDGWAKGLTERARQAGEQLAASLGIRAVYLRSSSADKEATARRIAAEDGRAQGPICLLSVVEPSYSPSVVGNRASGKLEVAMRPRRCVWQYLYFDDPQLGFGHLRLETWLPFTIKGCLNGRHWLERSLAAEGIGYVKDGNCFRWIEDFGRAQQLLDAQLRTDWPRLLDGLTDRCFPVVRDLFGQEAMNYYWSAEQTEWATDIAFRSTGRLDRLFPLLARHGLVVSDAASVMRYLGRIDPGAALPPKLTGDIRGDRRRRHEGLCVKHRVGGNSVKTYNKAGNVLRVETTIADPRDFKVFRAPDDDRARQAKWLAMRKGVADLERRARIGQRSNERYLEALSACETEATLLESVGQLCRRTRRGGRSARALNPLGENDFHLLKFLAQGQWTLAGFRNRDLAEWIDPQADRLRPEARRKLTARISRLLSLLKTHGLIHKVPKTHRYQLSKKGQEIAALIVSASALRAKDLIKKAA